MLDRHTVQNGLKIMMDDILFRFLEQEKIRQKNTINLIASENYAPSDIKRMCGSVLMNKYVEGYPGHRYYAGCSVVDDIEQETVQRFKNLFGVEHVNVQPHSGTQANFAVYFAVLKPGDTILSMSLDAGGHLTHGHKVNLSGSLYNIVSYGVDDHGYIDYEQVARLAQRHKPKLIIAGASSYSRIIDFEQFGAIARAVSALFMADISHIAGLVVAGVHPTPVGHADIITTTTHKTLNGPRGAIIMCKQELATVIDRAVMPGTQGGAFMHEIAAKGLAAAYAMTPEFHACQKQIVLNAQAMAQQFVKYGYTLISGGTDNHLFVVDVRSFASSGKYIEALCERYGVTLNRNAIPRDTLKPMLAGGIRIGTPAVTTRGLKEEHCRQIVHIIHRIIQSDHAIIDPTIVSDIASLVAIMNDCGDK